MHSTEDALSDCETSRLVDGSAKQETRPADPKEELRCARGRRVLQVLGLLATSLVALLLGLRASRRCEGVLDGVLRGDPTTALELLDVEAEIHEDQREAADSRAMSIAGVLNAKTKSAAAALVREAAKRAGVDAVARRRMLGKPKSSFMATLKEAKGLCYIESANNGGVYLSVDADSQVRLAKGAQSPERWRIIPTDGNFIIKAVDVPDHGAHLSYGGRNTVLMGLEGQGKPWQIEEVPQADGLYFIKAVRKGASFMSHDGFGALSLVSKGNTESERWKIPCMTQQEALKSQRKANCAFNIIYAMQYLARSGLLVQAAAKMCPDAKGLRDKVCALNGIVLVSSFSNLALSLSNAASTCAETTNVGALCASGVEALVAALAMLGAGSLVTATGCNPSASLLVKAGVPVGATPAELGGPAYFPQGRRLWFGGGHANTLGQCVLDFTQVAWSLGSVGLAITAAVRDTCPPRGTGTLQSLTQSGCAIDISAVLYAFGRIAMYLALAVIHCTNELNLQALCAAGISAVVSAAAQLIVAGNAFYITCNKGLEVERAGGHLPPGVSAAAEAGLTRRLSEGSLYNISDPSHLPHFDDMDSALKVLEQFSDHEAGRLGLDIDSLSQRFGSPEELWSQLGFNVSEPPAPATLGHESERFVRLMAPVLSEEDVEKVAEAVPSTASQMWQLPFARDKCF